MEEKKSKSLIEPTSRASKETFNSRAHRASTHCLQSLPAKPDYLIVYSHFTCSMIQLFLSANTTMLSHHDTGALGPADARFMCIGNIVINMIFCFYFGSGYRRR